MLAHGGRTLRKNMDEPANLLSSPPPKPMAQPRVKKAAAPMAASHMFLRRIECTLFERRQPASHIAKPACSQKTSAVQRITQPAFCSG